MFEITIIYYDDNGCRQEAEIIYTHTKKEAQKECERISNEIGIECQVGSAIFID